MSTARLRDYTYKVPSPFLIRLRKRRIPGCPPPLFPLPQELADAAQELTFPLPLSRFPLNGALILMPGYLTLSALPCQLPFFQQHRPVPGSARLSTEPDQICQMPFRLNNPSKLRDREFALLSPLNRPPPPHLIACKIQIGPATPHVPNAFLHVQRNFSALHGLSSSSFCPRVPRLVLELPHDLPRDLAPAGPLFALSPSPLPYF